MAAGVCQAVSIDFDSLGDGTVVNTQFPGVTFGSIGSREIVTADDFNLGSSLPYYIITATLIGQLTGTDPVFVDFSTPVKDLVFLTLGDDNAGQQATVTVFVNGVNTAVIPLMMDGVFGTPQLVDLSAYQNVTRIEIGNVTDGGGLAYDDFSFNTDAAPVPDGASTCSLLGMAVACLAWLRRRVA